MKFVRSTRSILLALLLLLPISLVTAYNAGSCCELAKANQSFVNSVPSLNQKCAQKYSAGLNAAKSLLVTYQFCRRNCPGVGVSQASQPSQWAAPIIQFILPSVIFSMTIPRKKKIDYDYALNFKGLRSKQTPTAQWRKTLNDFLKALVYAVMFIFIMLPIIIDTMIWIFMIMIGAGNLIVAGLLEAHLDFRVVQYCREGEVTNEEDLERKRDLLATIVAGNLQQDKGEPQKNILAGLLLHPPGTSEIKVEDMFKSRLLSLLDVQASFGGAVGSPVLFFLGAFIYTILDLQQNPSSEDAAISLAFGIEWMNIVNVAIVSGCLLACNNPSTSAGIAGVPHEALEKARGIPRPPTSQRLDGHTPLASENWDQDRFLRQVLGWSDAYETAFQPVSLWDRGVNKMAWIKKSKAWNDDASFRKALEIGLITWAFQAFIAIILVALPPALGGAVAYYFPPRGVGCRCLSFMIYGTCQGLLCMTSVWRNATRVKANPLHPPPLRWWWKLIYVGLWAFSFVAAILGTTFQIVGVFRNCICATLTPRWYRLWHNNPTIDLATDTQAARDASRYWIMMGIIATVFVGSVSYLGWWYQKLLRHGFTEAVRRLHLPRDNVPSHGASGDLHRDNTGHGGIEMIDRGEHQDEATHHLLGGPPPSRDAARDSTSSQRPLVHVGSSNMYDDVIHLEVRKMPSRSLKSLRNETRNWGGST